MADDPKNTTILTMSSIGDRLRQARESKNLSIGQVNKQTKIHTTVLKALEDGNCDTMLNPAYVKSFLKKYSEYLGLDAAKMLKDYRTLRPDAAPAAIVRGTEERPAAKERADLFPAIKLAVIGVLAAALIGLAVWGAAAIIKNARPSGKRQTQSKAKTASSKPKSAPKTSAAKAAAQSKGTEMAIPRSAELKLLLIVNKTVRVSMKADGVLLFDRVLPRGTVEMFTADKAFNIYTASGESIFLVLNGKSIGSPGKGTLKNIEVTRSGVKVK